MRRGRTILIILVVIMLLVIVAVVALRFLSGGFGAKTAATPTPGIRYVEIVTAEPALDRQALQLQLVSLVEVPLAVLHRAQVVEAGGDPGFVSQPAAQLEALPDQLPRQDVVAFDQCHASQPVQGLRRPSAAVHAAPDTVALAPLQ